MAVVFNLKKKKKERSIIYYKFTIILHSNRLIIPCNKICQLFYNKLTHLKEGNKG